VTTTSLTANSARSLQAAGSRRHRRAFWVVAFVFLAVMALGTVPSPLYSLYQDRDGFSLFMVIVIYAVYAVGVIGALLLVVTLERHSALAVEVASSHCAGKCHPHVTVPV
jgi:nitrate reductase NapE component